MNFREGTRRLALLLGALGIIAGSFASYVELQTVLPQRTAHNHFEQLANSEVVKQERQTLQAAPDFIPDPSTKTAKPGSGNGLDYNAIAKKYGGTSVASNAGAKEPSVTPDPYAAYGGHAIAPAKTGVKEPQTVAPNDWQTVSPAAPTYLDANGNPISSKVSKDGIGTINWGHDYGVASIETEDGQTLYPTPAPSAWLYLLIALFPIFGFIIPWAAIRAIGWVGAGFVQSAR